MSKFRLTGPAMWRSTVVHSIRKENIYCSFSLLFLIYFPFCHKHTHYIFFYISKKQKNVEGGWETIRKHPSRSSPIRRLTFTLTSPALVSSVPYTPTRGRGGGGVAMAAAEKTKPVLYSEWMSSCSYRVRIALNLKGNQRDQWPRLLLSSWMVDSVPWPRGRLG